VRALLLAEQGLKPAPMGVAVRRPKLARVPKSGALGAVARLVVLLIKLEMMDVEMYRHNPA